MLLAPLMVVILIALLGFALLMVVHESGHLLAARAFGMRVTRFSIGFGPTIVKHQPRGSDTVYQVALIPFLAYVQIAGMNPLEEADPKDRGSYANASLVGRIITIFAGSFANYLFASVLFFAAFVAGLETEPTKLLKVLPNTPAEQAQLLTGDEVLSVQGKPVADFEALRTAIAASPPEQPLAFTVLREGKELTLQVTPRRRAADGKAEVGVGMLAKRRPLPAAEAAQRAIVQPAVVVKVILESLGRMLSGREKPQLSGPPAIFMAVSGAAEDGAASFFYFLGILSANLAVVNLLPFPALDGGRLCFLIYEAVTRRRPNATIEAYVHAIGFLMLISLIAVVSFFDVQQLIKD